MKSFDVVIKPVGGNKESERSILIDAKNKEAAHEQAQLKNPDHIVLRDLTRTFK